ncbi:Inner membrane protein yibH [Raoultella terrigena]|uniref:Inner membrane protein yibH n=1 Tax=Raoultella terrigena TaxID=577 RepID=A0A4V6J1C0_RAOTE|nr:Inner membrane protein yibH [Raoultella terrigena]
MPYSTPRLSWLKPAPNWAKAKVAQSKAASDAARRRDLSRNVISAEDLESAGTALSTANAVLEAAKAVTGVAQASLEHAQWQLSQTVIKAPVDGWVTNLSTRVGDYASVGRPLFALVDSHSFYVIGYFEETKLRHIRAGDSAEVILYSSKQKLQGHVSSIGRAIVDQSVESGAGLVADIKPNIPWVRLAQRVPVRIELSGLPPEITLISGTTCTVSIGRP